MKYTAFIALFFLILPRACAAAGAVPVTTPVIVSTIPHDTLSFTQGIFWCNGLLYESTGLYGRSSLRCLDPKTGRIIQNIPVADIFAEGIAKMGSTIVQLSWREKAALIYSFPDLKTKGSFSYEGEGWGLTSSGASFIMSNGSDTLYIRNKQFRVIAAVAVRCGGKPLVRLNELEYVNGLVYANVWFDNSIYVIHPKTGAVVRTVDCTPLVSKAAVSSDQDVLNGIAYNSKTATFYITGKNWRYIFEVKL